MKYYFLAACLFCAHCCFAQFKLSKPDKNTLPKSIKYVGNVIESARWKDSTGDNIVILTIAERTQSSSDADGGFTDAALYAYHYLVSEDSIQQTWKVYDFVKECPVDIFLNFVDKSFAVTDLNKDGNAEVWIMYKVSCQGDVSPVPMKIIMYQNNKKFALRGTTQVAEGLGGEYTIDEAFKTGPTEFREYAIKLWNQHKIEKWEE